MKKAITKAARQYQACITEEHQQLRNHTIFVTLTYVKTGRTIKGSPLKLGKRSQLLADLSHTDIKRLGYLAAIEYQEKLNAKKKTLK